MRAPEHLPRWIGPIVAILGALALVNGLEMLLSPVYWYNLVPGVSETGPLNTHLVADAGTFNIPIGLGLMLAARDPYRNVLVIAIAAGAGLLHSLLHLYSHVAGWLPLDHLGTEILGIYIPAAILLALIPIILKRPKASTTPRRVAS
ncbi:MAG TPA: hypothetical protein VGI47_09990 [Candidatus Binataceae bacterium]